MYSTCTFCYSALGRNEVLEYLEVGRRVAFDPAKGCVWAVCPQCARWNLVPIEERWEIVDECERRFRQTALRYTSGNIGLAWLADAGGREDGEGGGGGGGGGGDMELIRVGPALRPEVAAWRYGRILARRRPIRMRAMDTIGAAYVGARRWLAARPTRGLRDPRAAAAELLLQVHGDRVLDVFQLPALRSPTSRADEPPIAVVRFRHLLVASLVRPESGKPWALSIPHDTGTLEIEGDSGVHAAARALAIINGTERGGGFGHALLEAAARKVDECARSRTYFNRVLAIALRSSWGRAERDMPYAGGGAAQDMDLLDGATSDVERLAFRLTGRTFWGRGGIGSEPITALLDVPLVDRLALEMAAHEETERRALEGELTELAASWREADEIATIADALIR